MVSGEYVASGANPDFQRQLSLHTGQASAGLRARAAAVCLESAPGADRFVHMQEITSKYI